MKTKKKISVSSLIIISLLFILPLITTSCQLAPGSNQQHYGAVDKAITEESASFNLSQQKTAKTPTRESEESTVGLTERKIIKEARLELITEDLSSIPEQVKNIVEDHDGYIADSRQWENHNQRKFYNYTLQVPAEDFTTVLTELKELGQLKEEHTNARDITEEYIDLKARLKNFKAQEERYLDLLDQAKDVEDILKIEKELNRVRREIERLEGRLNYYDNKVSLSTINLHISQPEPVINTGWSLTDSFKQAARAFIRSINLIIVLIGQLIPWILVIGIAGFIIYKTAKKIFK